MQTQKVIVRPWLLIILLILLFGEIGFFTWRYWSIKNQPVVGYPLNTVSTSELKTYTNTQYGFSFVYPKDWTVGQEGNISSSINIYLSSNIKDASPVMNVWIEKTNLSLDQKKAELISKSMFREQGQIKISGETAYEGIGSGMNGYYSIITKKDQYFYQLGFQTPSEDKSTLTDSQKQILSSFKFSN